MDIKGVFKNFANKIIDNMTTAIDNMTVADDIKIKGNYSIGKGSRKIKPSVVSNLKKYSPIGVGAVAAYEGGKTIGNKDSEEEYRKKVIEEILEGNKNNDRFTKRNKK